MFLYAAAHYPFVFAGPVYSNSMPGEGMPSGPPPPGNYPHQGGPTDYPHGGPLSHMPGGHPAGDNSSVMNNTNNMNSSDMHSVDIKPQLHNSGNYPSPVPVMSPGGDHRLHGEGPGTPSTPQTLNHSGGGAHPLSHAQQPNNITKSSTNGDTSAGDFNFDPAPILESDTDPTLDVSTCGVLCSGVVYWKEIVCDEKEMY